MADLVAVISTAFIPLASFISLSIYLSIHPSSPFRHLDSKRRIALPIHREEPLNGTSDKTEEDPFDIVNPVVCDDGTPVEPEKFWASMWKRKVALLVALVPPLTCNILLLVFTALGDLKGEDKTIAILVPVLLIPAHLVALFMGFVYLGENDTPSHWSTTIHLSSNLFVQFIVLAIFALLPSTPLPSAPPSAPSLLFAIFTRRSLFNLTPLTPLNVSKNLLPILHIPPLLIVLFVRRGPPLYLALDAIYPPKITDAVPSNSAALDPGKTNVTQEVQATVPEWLLFSYATDVVRQGYVAESMDIWDLPILQASMREIRKSEPNPRYSLMCTQARCRVTRRCVRYMDGPKEGLGSGRASTFCGSSLEPILGH